MTVHQDRAESISLRLFARKLPGTAISCFASILNRLARRFAPCRAVGVDLTWPARVRTGAVLCGVRTSRVPWVRTGHT